jgi:hypothetical protein
MARPLKWDNPDELEKAVDEYFNTDINPTWTGLALHLGFVDRGSLNDYMKKEGFSLPLKKALLRVEKRYENGLFGKNPAGSIFALKNFGWTDKREIDQKTEHSGGLTIRIIKRDTSGDSI